MEIMDINIKPPFIKLDSLLKFANVFETGGMAKEAIISGEIMLNGVVCLERGKKVKSGDIVTIDNQIVLNVK